MPSGNHSCKVNQIQCRDSASVLPEEGVVFDADLPQSLRGPMVGQLEAYGALELLILSGEGSEGSESVGRGVKKKGE